MASTINLHWSKRLGMLACFQNPTTNEFECALYPRYPHSTVALYALLLAIGILFIWCLFHLYKIVRICILNRKVNATRLSWRNELAKLLTKAVLIVFVALTIKMLNSYHYFDFIG